MKRWLFDVAAGVSLLLALAVGVLWMLGGVREADLRYHHWPAADESHSVFCNVKSTADTLILAVNVRHFPPRYFAAISDAERAAHHERFPSGLGVSARSWGPERFYMMPPPSGFGAEFGVYPQAGWTSRFAMIHVPHAFMLALLSILPLLGLASWRRARRLRLRGMCPVCGYDLRATPERCPECGTAVKPPSSKTVVPR